MGDPNYATEGMIAMDRWLAAVEADHGSGTLAAKIVRDRPSDITTAAHRSRESIRSAFPASARSAS